MIIVPALWFFAMKINTYENGHEVVGGIPILLIIWSFLLTSHPKVRLTLRGKIIVSHETSGWNFLTIEIAESKLGLF